MNRDTRNALLIVLGVLIFLGASLYVGKSLAGPSPEQVQQTQAEFKAESIHRRQQLHGALVYECNHLYGNLQRWAHDKINAEIRGLQKTKRKFFNIPPGQFHRLVRIQVQAKRRELKKVPPVNCGAFWHFLARN